MRSVAFEMLGPPRLTKLLYEAFVLSRLFRSVRALGEGNATEIARDAERLLLEREPDLRRLILSVGIPILLSDGESILRGKTVVVPPDGRGADMAPRGWVDLRVSNFEQWVRRAKAMAERPRDVRTGSNARWTDADPDAPIAPPRMAVWIFEEEDGGFRVKR